MFRPECPSSTYCPATGQSRATQYAARRSLCASRENPSFAWSSVDTLVYTATWTTCTHPASAKQRHTKKDCRSDESLTRLQLLSGLKEKKRPTPPETHFYR